MVSRFAEFFHLCSPLSASCSIDWEAWAAIGAMLAVFVALGQSWHANTVARHATAQAKANELEAERSRAAVAAVYFGPEVFKIDNHIQNVTSVLTQLEEMKNEVGVVKLAEVLRCDARLPDIGSLAGYGMQIGTALAAVGSSVQAWNEYVDGVGGIVWFEAHPFITQKSHMYGMLEIMHEAASNMAHALNPLLPNPIEVLPMPPPPAGVVPL